MIEDALPLALGALVLAILWDVRRRAADRNEAAFRHTAAAHKLLAAHAEALRDFVEHPDAPTTLKAMLIGFSDASSSRDVMVGLARFLSARSDLAFALRDDQVDAELRELEGLRPELRRAFASAVLTGTMAGLLRWPETAGQFEGLTAQLMSDPKHDEATAISVTRFPARHAQAAMAMG